MVARPKSKTPARHPVEVIRVQYWFQGLKERTGCATAYQLEMLLDPLLPPTRYTKSTFRSKWKRFEYGKHTPRASVLNRYETRIPGIARELQHPLWEILKKPESCSKQLDDWFLKLSPKVQSCVFKPSAIKNSTVKQRRELAYWLPKQLMGFADLDVLAAFLLYWLEAKQTGKTEHIRGHAIWLYRLLLILGVKLKERGIAEGLFDVFSQIVFKPTQWGDEVFATDSGHYLDSVYLLNLTMRHVEDFTPQASWPARCKIMYKLLDGKYGFDVLLGLRPFLRPNNHAEPPTEDSHKQWLCCLRLKLWGWIHLNHQSRGTLTNDKVYDLLSVALGLTQAEPQEVESAKQTVQKLMVVLNKNKTVFY